VLQEYVVLIELVVRCSSYVGNLILQENKAKRTWRNILGKFLVKRAYKMLTSDACTHLKVSSMRFYVE